MDSQASQIDSSKQALIVKLKGLISDAKAMSFEELCRAGDYSNNLKYPQTKSEHIVTEALNLLLDQDWADDDPVLNEMMSVLGLLDTGVNRPDGWRDLFALAEELRS